MAPSEGTVSISQPQVVFAWKHPDLGPGLSPGRVLSGYRVFTQVGQAAPAMLPGVLLPADVESAMVPAAQVGPYDRIGLAAEDAVGKDGAGNLLLSPVGWFAPGNGTVTVLVSEVNPDSSSPFSEDITIPVAGAGVSIEYTERGATVTRGGTTDATGQVRFDVPLDTPVAVTFGNERKTVTCTQAAPEQFTGFGGLMVQVVQGVTIPNVVPPETP
jgi:hypothetical protein